MKIFDPVSLEVYPYAEREKNVFYEAEEFKTRIIELPPGGKMPECEMASHVIFYVISGETEITVNGESIKIGKGKCMISEPALISMKTDAGVRIMGIQVFRKK